MGGKIAQFVAAQRPPHLRKLVFAFGSRVRIEKFQLAAMCRAVSPDVMERLVSDALLAQREAWFGWYDRGRGRTAEFADRLGNIAVASVVVAGEFDPFAQPQRLKRDVAERIPGAVREPAQRRPQPAGRGAGRARGPHRAVAQ